METHPIYPNNTENSAAQQPSLAFQPFIPLRKEIKNLPPFPIDCLPPELREYVQAVAVHTQTPVDMAAGIALGVLAGCLQGKVRVEGNIEHYEQCSLYTLIIAPPGERKSATINAMTSVIADYEQAFNERQKPLMRRNKQEREALQRQINRLTRQLEQKYDSMTEMELQHAQDQLNDLPDMKPLRVFADDCTSESLVKLLSDNGGRMTVVSAEGGVFDNISGRYSKAPNIDVWLKGISGDTIRVDRIGRDPEYIRSPALSAILTVQPQVLNVIMDNATMGGRGLLARFMYINIPATGIKEFRSPPVPEEIKNGYHDLIFRLMDIPADEPITLHLSDDAVALMSRHFEKIERHLATDGRDMREWGKKLGGMILRIAGLLHMAAGAEGDVSEETIRNAIIIGNYAYTQARYAFSLMGCDESIEKALFVAAKLWKKRLSSISLSELYQMCRGKYFKKASEFTPTIELLLEYGYVATLIPPYLGTGRPPQEMLYVNPELYSNPEAL